MVRILTALYTARAIRMGVYAVLCVQSKEILDDEVVMVVMQ